MARIIVDGFEHGLDVVSGAECANTYDQIAISEPAILSLTTSTLAARTGQYGLRLVNTGTPGASHTCRAILRPFDGGAKNTGYNVTTTYFSFWFRIVQNNTTPNKHIYIAALDSSTSTGVISITSDGRFWLNKSAASTATLSLNTWYQAKWTRLNASMQLEIVGVETINLASGGASASYCLGILTGYGDSDSLTPFEIHYDDAIADDASMPGSAGVYPLVADRNGDVFEWNSGSYASLDEIPHDGDTSYAALISPFGTDKRSLLKWSGVSGSSVRSARFDILHRHTGFSIATRYLFKNGGSEVFTSPPYQIAAPNSSYTLASIVRDVEPVSGAAWSLANLRTLQWGQWALANGTTREQRWSMALAQVEGASLAVGSSRKRLMLSLGSGV